MEIRSELDKLARFMPAEKLVAKISLAMEFLPENPTHILPSIVVARDGLALARLLLVTDRYLCEVPIAGPSQFDLYAKKTVRGYRFLSWTHEVKEGEESKAVYHVAQVALYHEFESMRTDLAYAGSEAERAAWLKQIVEAIPARLIL